VSPNSSAFALRYAQAAVTGSAGRPSARYPPSSENEERGAEGVPAHRLALCQRALLGVRSLAAVTSVEICVPALFSLKAPVGARLGGLAARAACDGSDCECRRDRHDQ
jgi:hypothetical protein